MAEIHVGDTGTAFVITIYDENDEIVDLSTATTLSIKIRKPGENSSSTKEGDLFTDGTDGKIQYLTEEDDLDKPGTYTLQAYVAFTDGTWHSTKATVQVWPNL